MARVLLISDEEASGLLWGANAGGHEVFVAGVPSRNPTVSISPKCKRFVSLPEESDFEDVESYARLATSLGELAKQLDVDVIVPSSFECVKFAIEQRDRLSQYAELIPLSSMETVDQLDDKNRFFEFCSSHGLPHPPSCLISSADDLGRPEFSQLTFPILTKPLLGAATGIEKFSSAAELEERVVEAESSFFPVLAQEWFDGEDIDFNGYALEGSVPVSSVMRTRVYERAGVSVELTDFVRHDEVSRLGRTIVERSRYTGPLNIDLRIRYSDNKVFLIEVNPRFWGRSMTSLIDGLNFVDAGIRLTSDRNWRGESSCNGQVWASSILPIVKGAVSGDTDARKYLRKLTFVQLKYQMFLRLLRLRSSFRGRSSV